jgi:subtilase family protein/peptidase inhibitor I9
MRALGYRRSATVLIGVFVLALVATTGAGASVKSHLGIRLHFQSARHGRLSAARAAAAARIANKRVIVVLRNQHRIRTASVAARRARARVEARERRPLLSRVRRSGGRVTRQFRTLNAFAATVSANERAQLRANRGVARVLPDVVVKLPAQANAQQPGFNPGAPNLPTPQPQPTSGICPTDPAKPLLEPEALQTTHTAFTDPATPQAQNLVDGAGVRVAFFADGLDINNPDLIRPDGSHVITDYRDFSGDGPDAETGAAEAFGDASSIAAQGRQVYDISQFVNPAHPLPPGCNITVRGMAPGASLIAMKVFGENSLAFSSEIVQGLDWAVNVDHANVLSESFGSQPIPDTATDLIKQFNEQAVAQGITVVQSTGDGGPEATVNSAASSAAEIAAGANTNFRGYAQTVSYGFQFAGNGWLSNQISSISTSGVDQGNHNLDLVAPGEVGWALCSPNIAVFTECVDFAGKGSGLQQFGGTSESAPLIAGAAALVIQAYRQAHGGATPSPMLVKQILTGTANDLGFPSEEQGAGQLDSLKAVQAAQSIDGGTPTGHGLVVRDTQVNVTAPGGTSVNRGVSVTNAGAVAQTVSAGARAITRTIRDDFATVNISDAGPTFIDQFGSPRPFATTTFTVPAGTDRLVEFDAWPGPNARVGVALIDPNGIYSAFTRPQGNGNHGQVDLERPTPGRWTALVFRRDGVFEGPVHLEFTSQRFGSVDTVTPSSLRLAPGQTGTFQLRTRLPNAPGDSIHDLVLTGSAGDQSTVPVTLRALVRLHRSGGRFAGTLIGGNGRGGSAGQLDTFEFDVPSGKPALNVGLTFKDDAGTNIDATLVDPEGNARSVTDTVRQAADNSLTQTHELQAFRVNPQAGRWKFVIDVTNPVGGNALSAPYSGEISFKPLSVRTHGLPTSARTVLTAGQPHTVTLDVRNDGVATEDFFADARQNAFANIQLASLVAQPTPLPVPPGRNPPVFLFPTQTDSVLAAAQATLPMRFDLTFFFGDPDVASDGVPAGGIATAQVSGTELSQGLWAVATVPVGPFAAPLTPGRAVGIAIAHTRDFDTDVASPQGNIWEEAAGIDDGPRGFNPVTIDPGKRGTLALTITPSAAPGTIVHGTLFVDDWSNFDFFGDEAVAIPYTYTVG